MLKRVSCRHLADPHHTEGHMNAFVFPCIYPCLHGFDFRPTTGGRVVLTLSELGKMRAAGVAAKERTTESARLLAPSRYGLLLCRCVI